MLLTAMYLGKMSLRFLLFAVTTVVLFRKRKVCPDMVCGIIFYYLLLCPPKYVIYTDRDRRHM